MVIIQNLHNSTDSKLSFKTIRTLLCVKYKSKDNKVRMDGTFISTLLMVKISIKMPIKKALSTLWTARLNSRKQKLVAIIIKRTFPGMSKSFAFDICDMDSCTPSVKYRMEIASKGAISIATYIVSKVETNHRYFNP
ncbi:MAG: hypothetical protein NC453_11985 [Muribaculum sp.]|nr:hypothetical protein [Muribaculum sp.]